MSTEDINRALGRLEGKIESIQSDVSTIKCELKSLVGFKAKVIGGAAVISSLIAALGWLLK